MFLFGDDGATANEILAEYHYLGAIGRGEVFRDDTGIIVIANPTSRRLPSDRWVELVRWCIRTGTGSQQWRAARRWILESRPEVTTVVSYSDPSVGHTGALYRASGWLWAPTWHRLREPPTGNGQWAAGERQAVKDRWVDVLRPDAGREALLAVQDDGIRRRMPWASYREPKWKRGIPQLATGGADFKRWRRDCC